MTNPINNGEPGDPKTELRKIIDLLEPVVNLGTPWTLAGDWMITGCIHIPYTDWNWCDRIVEVAKKNLKKPRKLLIAGDFFSLDNFSTWAQIVHCPTWKEERETAKALFKVWLEIFQEIKMLMGNHERRLQRWAAGNLDETDLIKMVISNPKRIEMSNFGHCCIEPGNWRVTHARNFSINALTVPEKLAQKFHQNIICFHPHRINKGWDRYGKYVIVEGGCLVDQNKLAYVVLDDNTTSAMQKGFVLLKDGTSTLFGDPPFTDWSKYG